MRCEAITDQLPDCVLDRLDEVSRARLDAHVAQCRDCAAELDLLRALRSGRPAPPADLEQRVVAAARTAPPRSWAPGRLAMAATIVFALVSGGLLLKPNGPLGGAGDGEGGGAGTQTEIVSLTSEDPLLHGGPGLNRLSEDELERLLAEMGS